MGIFEELMWMSICPSFWKILSAVKNQINRKNETSELKLLSTLLVLHSCDTETGKFKCVDYEK